MKTVQLTGIVAFALAMSAGPASAGDGTLVVASPSNNIEVEFSLEQGAPRYSVQANGRQLVAPSALGLLFQGDIKLDQGFAIRSTARSSFHQTWEQPWGEQRWIENHYNELRVELQQGKGHALVVAFRVFDNGVAFRYELPQPDGGKDLVLLDERTEFSFADLDAWWIPAYQPDRYEQLYRRAPLSTIEAVHTPLTIEGDNAVYAVHEAAVHDFPTMVLRGSGSGRLSCELVPWADGVKARIRTPFVGPWRMIEIGRRPIDLLTNYMVLNLSQPGRLADTSWIRPMKYIGIWWGMHINKFSWGSGPNHGATTERAKAYIDLARMLKIQAVLVEGWNVGWDQPWGDGFSFTQPYPDYDLRAVADYARINGIELIAHNETAGAIGNYERQIDSAFSYYRWLGIRMIKTGYVGARVEGDEWHHGQFMVRHQELVARKAAEYGIMVDVHEPVKDTGLRRTFPNVLTREGARGMEWDAWGATGSNPPSHTTILPFTRGLAAPFDFTPGLFNVLASQNAGFNRSKTTLMKQLAFYVVIYSPLQMAADLPENYVNHPAFKFIQDVAVDWDVTVPLNGEIGQYVTIARKARGGAEWFLGSLTNEDERTLRVPLSFLDAGRSYCAEIYRDGSGANWESNPYAYEIHRMAVSSQTTLAVWLARGGGQAIRFVPDSTCAR